MPILYRAMLPLVGPLRDRSMLDFGCGDGHLITRFARHEPRRVVCIDQSPDLLAATREAIAELPPPLAERFELHRGDEALLPTREKFDVVTCSLMLMMCPTRDQLDATIAGLIRSATPQGRVLLVVTHPCFRDAMHAAYHNAMPADFSYWHSGRGYEVVLDPDEQQVPTTFQDYHWTLTDHAHAIARAGGAIRDLVEVPGEYDGEGKPLGDPAYLVFVVTPTHPQD